ncbi:MAG: STAS domain-containing protein [Planctomycetota bacterium]|nr:STAS domain-containing protein [Planctomycetota bacterium]
MPAPERMYQIDRRGEVDVVSFRRSIFDAESIEAMRRELRALIDRTPQPRLVLDCAQLKQMSSLFLGAVMELSLKLRGNTKSHRLRVCAMSPQVRDVFDVMRLSDAVEIHADLATALTSFEARG